MSDLPTRYPWQAEGLPTAEDTFRYLKWLHDRGHWLVGVSKPIEILITEARADGTLRTAQEFRDSLDYEAAMKEMHHLRMAGSGMGPYKDRFGTAEINGVIVPRISDYDTAKRIVDAALGDPE